MTPEQKQYAQEAKQLIGEIYRLTGQLEKTLAAMEPEPKRKRKSWKSNWNLIYENMGGLKK